jgi:hypothetical protein
MRFCVTIWEGSIVKTKSEARNSKLETKMSNPKLEILNSKQTQMFKGLNSKPIVEKSKLTFEFCILDLLRIWSLVFRV